MPKGRKKLLFVSTVDHRYIDKPRITHKSYTHSAQAEKINVYIYPTLPLFGAWLSALLPWLDDCHDDDHHYHQQYDDGIAHPLPRVPLQLLGVLKSTHTLLYVVGSIRNLETEEEINVNSFRYLCCKKKKILVPCPYDLMQKYEILTCVSMLLIMSP